MAREKQTEISMDKINTNTNNTELWKLFGKITYNNTNPKESNIIHNEENSAKKIMNINFIKNKNSKFRIEIDPNFTTEDELLNIEIWNQILNKKKKHYSRHR